MAMGKNYSVSTQINRPIDVVFEAVTSKESLCSYFVDRCSSDMTPGATVEFTWEQYGTCPVTVQSVDRHRAIEFTLNSTSWNKTEGPGYEVLVRFAFEATDDGRGTVVTVSETGWPNDENGYKASHDNCGGWMHMILSLKVRLEHDIDLRA